MGRLAKRLSVSKTLAILVLAAPSVTAQSLPPIHPLGKPIYYRWSSKRFTLKPIAVLAGERIEIIEECNQQPMYPCAVQLQDQYSNKCNPVDIRGAINFGPFQQNIWDCWVLYNGEAIFNMVRGIPKVQRTTVLHFSALP